MQHFFDGFMFTSGSIAAFLCLLAVAAFCEFVSKLTSEFGRNEIRNAIVDNADEICGLSAEIKKTQLERLLELKQSRLHDEGRVEG